MSTIQPGLDNNISTTTGEKIGDTGTTTMQPVEMKELPPNYTPSDESLPAYSESEKKITELSTRYQLLFINFTILVIGIGIIIGSSFVDQHFLSILLPLSKFVLALGIICIVKAFIGFYGGWFKIKKIIILDICLLLLILLIEGWISYLYIEQAIKADVKPFWNNDEKIIIVERMAKCCGLLNSSAEYYEYFHPCLDEYYYNISCSRKIKDSFIQIFTHLGAIGFLLLFLKVLTLVMNLVAIMHNPVKAASSIEEPGAPPLDIKDLTWYNLYMNYEEKYKHDLLVRELSLGRVIWSLDIDTDFWIYLKNTHPIISLFKAHPLHTYTLFKRILTLVALAMFSFSLPILNDPNNENLPIIAMLQAIFFITIVGTLLRFVGRCGCTYKSRNCPSICKCCRHCGFSCWVFLVLLCCLLFAISIGKLLQVFDEGEKEPKTQQDIYNSSILWFVNYAISLFIWPLIPGWPIFVWKWFAIKSRNDEKIPIRDINDIKEKIAVMMVEPDTTNINDNSVQVVQV